MIFGHITHSESYRALLANPVWQIAFDALRNLTPESPLGITELNGEKQFLNVHEYKTLPQDECRFEHHHHTVDLQYIISGGECTDWAPTWELEPDGEYLEHKDFQYLLPPSGSSEQLSNVHLTDGYFAIFFPSDAHRPKINDGIHEGVYKAVVKIDLSLLKNQKDYE